MKKFQPINLQGAKTQPLEYPVLDAYALENQYHVWCVDCRVWHCHGRGDGHRVAHCYWPLSRYKKSGYILRYAGEWKDRPVKHQERGHTALQRMRVEEAEQSLISLIDGLKRRGDDSVAPTWWKKRRDKIVFRTMKILEPGLVNLERDIRTIKREQKGRQDDFCANYAWYGEGLKKRYMDLVGWERKLPPESMQNQFTYSLGYEFLYGLLPDCRHVGSLCY